LAARVAAAEPSRAQQQQAAALSRRATDLIDAGKLSEAESALRQSLAIVPAHPTRLYNLACVLAGEREFPDAMGALEEAADAGFTDFTNLAHNSTLAPLQRTPRYAAMLARRDQIVHHAGVLAVAALRGDLGEQYLYDVDEAHKLVFAVALDRTAEEMLKSDLLAIEAAEESEVFSHPSDEFIRIVIPSEADFPGVVPAPHLGGDYDDTTRTAVSMRLGQYMTHEFTHALHAADQHALGQEHPVWLSEGLASLYEAAEIDGAKLIPHDNSRLPSVRFAARSGEIIALGKLLALSREDFNNRPNLAYGEAGCLLRFLQERGMLKPFYDAYTSGYNADPTGRLALQQVSGLQLPALQKEFVQWIEDRSDPAAATRPGGPLLRLTLSEGIDGLRVTNIGASSPAASGDLRSGDVLTGIDGKEVRDRATMERIVGGHAAGDKIQLRVRRGEEYRDVEIVLGKRG